MFPLNAPPDDRARCPWSLKTAAETRYHDEEWGVPVRDDAVFFEFLVLESAQAGLSWSTILHKRAGYHAAFAGFEAARVAAFTGTDVERLLAEPGIVRNRAKILATVSNAQCFLKLQAEEGSFADFAWSFVGGVPRVNRPTQASDVPAVTEESEAFAKALKQRGFKFLGPTVMYAFMQATGLVNDHLVSCFRQSSQHA
jgi:DNA-3-methyladenine glycosylase I